jgi:hypothetical protein
MTGLVIIPISQPLQVGCFTLWTGRLADSLYLMLSTQPTITQVTDLHLVEVMICTHPVAFLVVLAILTATLAKSHVTVVVPLHFAEQPATFRIFKLRTLKSLSRIPAPEHQQRPQLLQLPQAPALRLPQPLHPRIPAPKHQQRPQLLQFPQASALRLPQPLHP